MERTGTFSKVMQYGFFQPYFLNVLVSHVKWIQKTHKLIFLKKLKGKRKKEQNSTEQNLDMSSTFSELISANSSYLFTPYFLLWMGL